MVKKNKTDNYPENVKYDTAIDYSAHVSFVPVKKIDSHFNPRIFLDDEKIDIGYVIRLITVLMQEIEKHKWDARNLALTLNHSLIRLLAYLEVKRDQQ
jgi:hypothetical protein